MNRLNTNMKINIRIKYFKIQKKARKSDHNYQKDQIGYQLTLKLQEGHIEKPYN
jgi:hypothetical protein